MERNQNITTVKPQDTSPPTTITPASPFMPSLQNTDVNEEMGKMSSKPNSNQDLEIVFKDKKRASNKPRYKNKSIKSINTKSNYNTTFSQTGAGSLGDANEHHQNNYNALLSTRDARGQNPLVQNTAPFFSQRGIRDNQNFFGGVTASLPNAPMSNKAMGIRSSEPGVTLRGSVHIG